MAQFSLATPVITLITVAQIHGVAKSRAQLSDWAELNWSAPVMKQIIKLGETYQDPNMCCLEEIYLIGRQS